MNHLFLGLSVFIASAVEMVEALTIVLAIGATREWRSTLYGMFSALIALGIVIAVFEPLLASISDESNPLLMRLWLVLGGLLTVFGLQWMRKAILRFSGLLASHDEDETFIKVEAKAKTVERAQRGIDWYAFVIVFKGVWLEGLEVVFIVLTFGASQGSIATGVRAALAALVVITLLGIVVRKPLSKVPENAMKFVVGIFLASFGTYFAAKGAGIVWPFGEPFLALLIPFYTAVGLGLIALLTMAKERVR